MTFTTTEKSVLPLVVAVKTVNEVRHRFVASSRLHLVERCELAATLLALEETLSSRPFHLLLFEPVCPSTRVDYLLCLS